MRKSHIFSLQFFWGAVGAATLCQSGSDFRRLAETNFWCYKIDANSTTETFNGLELSEPVLARDWNSPEEDAAWADL